MQTVNFILALTVAILVLSGCHTAESGMHQDATPGSGQITKGPMVQSGAR